MASDEIPYFDFNEIFNEINEIRHQLSLLLQISDEIENIRFRLLFSLPD
jgi:hypothetical protein